MFANAFDTSYLNWSVIDNVFLQYASTQYIRVICNILVNLLKVFDFHFCFNQEGFPFSTPLVYEDLSCPLNC